MEYGLYEAALAGIHLVDPEDLKAFRARIRVLRYEGVPGAPMPGKGSRIEYSFGDLAEASLGLRMAEIGLPPSRIALLVGRLTSMRPDWVALVEQYDRDFGEDTLLCFTPNAPKLNFDIEDIFFHLDKTSRVLLQLKGDHLTVYFNLLINVSKLLRDCRSALRETT
jgi:hypothetical protein